jgi:hypothetical protein
MNALSDNSVTRYSMKIKQLKALGGKDYLALFKMNVV